MSQRPSAVPDGSVTNREPGQEGGHEYGRTDDPPDTVVISSPDDVVAYAERAALSSGTVSTVGIETEWFVVDVASPLRPVEPERTLAALESLPGRGKMGGDVLPVLPGGSRVTFEPGGQLELSGPPQPLAAAVRACTGDLALTRAALAESGLALAAMGTDPLRPPHRLLGTPRYEAMERYFCECGYRAGPVMMCSTTSVQVNVDAGGPDQWSGRWWLAHALGPVLVAMFAASPVVAGRRTGWMSTRQAVWADIDPSRTRPALPGAPRSHTVPPRTGPGPGDGGTGEVGYHHGAPDRGGLSDRGGNLGDHGAVGGDVVRSWARFLLDAKVMLVRDAEGRCSPADGRCTFADWVQGRAGDRLPSRRPTVDDLSYHATTLFPPVRPRGWLELRYLDGQPSGLWPVAVAVVVGLLDDPVAAERAADICAHTAGRWTAAALLALRDPALHRAAVALMPLARAGAARLGADTETLDALDSFTRRYVEPGRCPAEDISQRWAEFGPTELLRQEAAPCAATATPT